jgi:hypothetical protein
MDFIITLEDWKEEGGAKKDPFWRKWIALCFGTFSMDSRLCEFICYYYYSLIFISHSCIDSFQ